MSAGTAAGAAGDVEVPQMMIPHHEQAVEMADLAVQNSSAASDVKAIAASIKAAQGPEISTMKGWLGLWGASQSSAPRVTDRRDDDRPGHEDLATAVVGGQNTEIGTMQGMLA